MNGSVEYISCVVIDLKRTLKHLHLYLTLLIGGKKNYRLNVRPRKAVSISVTQYAINGQISLV